ncbi:RNA polymerase sigma factor [Lewinella sp. LCG006]|uniref:RNA polymerase sigma factor n=1 Tax=Lewinella sp. LCG006 TaxID=3231911 RepID=UPI00346149F9
MPVKAWFSTHRPCNKFENHQQLYEGLVAMDNQAILCLQTKALPMVGQQVSKMGISGEEVEEILNQSTLIFLQKIEEGTYEFKGHAPTTYLVEVAKRLAMAKVRRKKPQHDSLEDYHVQHLSEHEALQRQRDAAALVTRFLNQLGEACEQVVRLHHIDGYSDDEVVKGRMTNYSTINSLKMKRSACMKKLIEIATKWKTSKNT